METLMVILPYAATMSIIGLVETALTKEIVDKAVKNTGDLDRANTAQGLSNILGGIFSTMGACAMIVPSNLNIMSGGK
jgi:SulP family sulfate permease